MALIDLSHWCPHSVACRQLLELDGAVSRQAVVEVFAQSPRARAHDRARGYRHDVGIELASDRELEYVVDVCDLVVDSSLAQDVDGPGFGYAVGLER